MQLDSGFISQTLKDCKLIFRHQGTSHRDATPRCLGSSRDEVLEKTITILAATRRSQNNRALPIFQSLSRPDDIALNVLLLLIDNISAKAGSLGDRWREIIRGRGIEDGILTINENRVVIFSDALWK